MTSIEAVPSKNQVGSLTHGDILDLLDEKGFIHGFNIQKFTPRLQDALALAAEAHAGQRRKLADMPFLAHPFETMLMLAELYGIDVEIVEDEQEQEDTEIAPAESEQEKQERLAQEEQRRLELEDRLIAALLHDTVEDSDGRVTLQRIAEEFNERVRDMVDIATRDKGVGTEQYYAKLCGTKNLDALRLVVVDKMHALTCRISELYKHETSDEAHPMELFNVSLKDKIDYYRRIFEVARDRLPADDHITSESMLLLEMYIKQIENFQEKSKKLQVM